jgi:hypothetical protein
MDAGSYDCLPWEIPPYWVSRDYQNNTRSSYKQKVHPHPRKTFKAKFEYAPNAREYVPGDIIRFFSAYHPKLSWQEWFVREEDKPEVCCRNHSVPRYAEKQYAMILARYKWVKYKWHGIYRDYGNIIMMLTGPKVGHVRKYYLKNPYRIISKFPYINGKIPKEVHKVIDPVLNQVKNSEMLTVEGRNKYLEILYRKFNPEESI